ncbi:MAG: virulence protein SciE type [Acidobacteriaceae bacterium]|nr:virulence protein SciE type [Acidobacteriaceae bacterium]
MTAQELFKDGKLTAAIQALGSQLRDRPADIKSRTFLFELLCFAGDYTRAEKHLSILAETNADAGVGALVYRSAISAEKKRQLFFENKDYQKSQTSGELTPRAGKLNGEAFQTIEDADPRIGPRLEVFIAGEYVWLPFEHIGTLSIPQPKLLRDTLWSNSVVTAGPALKGQDFGQVILPVLYPFSFQHSSDAVKLGRETEWTQSETEGDIPFGQKMFLLDGGERVVSILEIRTLEFDDAAQSDLEADGAATA